MIKILLTSDIHLGLNSDAIPVPESARLGTFRKIAALAKQHDLFLIAGDLFHYGNVNGDVLDAVAAEFRAIRERGVEVLLVPGESDLTPNGTVPPHFFSLGASHVFSDPGILSRYSFAREDQQIHLYGSPPLNMIDLSGFQKAPGEGFHMGLFHVDFNLTGDDAAPGVFCLDKRNIRRLELDFYALGHRHFFKMYKLSNRIVAAYPGSPEATAADETGDRYALSIVVKDNEIFQIKRLTVNTIRLREGSLDCTGRTDARFLMEFLDGEKSQKDALTLVLTGERNFRLEPSLFHQAARDYFHLTVKDESIPSLDILSGEFLHENTLRSEFFGILREKIDRNELPAGVSPGNLADILNRIMQKGSYMPEDWLCR